MPTEAQAPSRRRLLDDRAWLPWTRAQNLADCFLFWLPVSGFPMRHEERVWLSTFLERLGTMLADLDGLRTEIFLQYKSIGPEVTAEFMKYRRTCLTMMGLGRRPGATLPALPTPEQLREFADKGTSFDVKDWIGDYTYWFLMKQPERQRALFLGQGGMTTIFLPPDPKAIPPRLPYSAALRAAHPTFQRFDVDAAHAATYAMGDAFLEQSKRIFGVGLEEEPQYEGLAFVLPLLDSSHFFAVTAEQRAEWFELFDVYVNESKADEGVVMAFANDYEDALLDLLEAMHAEGLHYPGGPR